MKIVILLNSVDKLVCTYAVSAQYTYASWPLNRCTICITPASNLGYLAPPPGQFFMGAKLFIGTPWMGNEGVLKKILVWAM